MELRKYLRILRAGWIIVVAAAMSGLAGGVAVTVLSPAVYSSTAAVLVSVPAPASATVAEVSQAEQAAQIKAASYVKILTSPAVLRSVIDSVDFEITAAGLAQLVHATSASGSSTIVITVTGPVAQSARVIADSLVRALTEYVADAEQLGDAADKAVQLTVTTEAAVATSPTSPRPAVNIILGLLLGVGLGMAIVFARILLDPRMRTVSEVAAALEYPVLGVIPKTRRATGTTDRTHIESLRRLGATVRALNLSAHHRGTVFASVAVDRDQVAIMLGLAAMLADAGAKVAVVDADLRYAPLTKHLGLQKAIGISDLFASQTSPLSAWQPGPVDGVSVLPAGRIESASHELLGSARAVEVFDTLTADFDCALIYSPPVLAVPDAIALGASVAGALLIVPLGTLTADELVRAVRSLELGGVRLLGLVVTNVPLRGPDSYEFRAERAYARAHR